MQIVDRYGVYICSRFFYLLVLIAADEQIKYPLG